MGPMVRGPKIVRRRVIKWGSAGFVALMAWSLVAAPASIGEEEELVEPYELSAYYTFGDAAPVQGYLDHKAQDVAIQTVPVPVGPTIAHSQSEVQMPSSSSGLAWLTEFGLLNGAHGTTTGNSVPTQASASQPGGDPQATFKVAGGFVGDEKFMRAEAGRASASAERGERPRGYSNSFVGNVYLLPAPGSPADPPGTYDPNATFPGNDGAQPAPDPAPQGQMAVVSIGSVASTSESVREGRLVKTASVAELNDVNIGNRTSDNRCANCVRIDFIRAEAFAEATGEPGGSRAGYRVTVGRACRRTFDAVNTKEIDQCVPLDPVAAGATSAAATLNAHFEKPFFTAIAPGTMMGIRIHVNETHASPARKEKTSSPPDDPCRNYAYPDARKGATENESCKAQGVQTGPDVHGGQEAKAIAEGVDLEIWTVTTGQFAPSDDAIENGPGSAAYKALDEDDDTPGLQVLTSAPCISQSGGGQELKQCPKQTISTRELKSIRRVQLTLGVAAAGAIARPCAGCQPPEDDDDTDVEGDKFFRFPDITIPEITIPEITIPPIPKGGTTIVNNGIGGPLAVKIDWSSVRFKPWAAKDILKTVAVLLMVGGSGVMIRRRMSPG